MKKTIYFIVDGTSQNNIIKSLNEIYKNQEKSQPKQNEKKDFWNMFEKKNTKNIKNTKKQKQIPLLNDPQLINLGIKELILFQQNEGNKKILNDNLSVYTSIDLLSIESSFVLYNQKVGAKIYPLPYISTNRDINDISKYIAFVNKFGVVNKKITHVSKYWNAKLNSLFFKNNVDIKKLNIDIDWKYIDTNNLSSISISNINSYVELLKNIFRSESKNTILLVSNGNVLEELLKRYKIKNISIIENSSLWKLNIEINMNNVIFTEYSKIYPTEYNCIPLKYQYPSNTFEYSYNNNKYILFNSVKTIPQQYIQTLKSVTLKIENKKENVKIPETKIELDSFT